MRGGKAPPLIPPEKERLAALLFLWWAPGRLRLRGQLLRGAQDALLEVLARPGVRPDPGGEDGVGRGFARQRALVLAVHLDLGPPTGKVGEHHLVALRDGFHVAAERLEACLDLARRGGGVVGEPFVTR